MEFGEVYVVKLCMFFIGYFVYELLSNYQEKKEVGDNRMGFFVFEY